jgi:dTMP kinase
LFLTFEGPEGSGKSTQARRLAARLRDLGLDPLESVEPGGTPIGTQIRRVLLDAKNQELSATAELLLMFAARAQNVDQWIVPAMAHGRLVISDRWTDSTLVYQGVARGLGSEVVYDIDRVACRGLVPDLTILVDIETEAGLARAHQRNARTNDVETRIDQHSIDFHKKVRAAYLQLAEDEPRRVRLVDGSRSQDEVAEEIWQIVSPLLQL